MSTFLSWLTSLALGNLVPAIVILVIGILTIRIVNAIVQKALDHSKLEKAAHSLIKSLVQVVLYLLLGLMVASSLGIDVSSIVALASVLTLAVSLAVQDALTNLIGGFTLLYTKPFCSGDYVEIAGQAGTVQEIGLAYTKLATPDNKLISLPNASVVASQIVNFSTTGTRRVEVSINAAYTEPSQKVIDALLEAGNVSGVLQDPAPAAVLTAYGESTISYSLRLWVKTEDYWNVFFTVNQNVRQVFEENGVKMSYPHLNVHLDK